MRFKEKIREEWKDKVVLKGDILKIYGRIKPTNINNGER